MRRFLFTSITGVETAISQIDELEHVVSIGEPGSVVPDRLDQWSRHPDNHLLRLEFDDLGLDYARRKVVLQRMIVGSDDPPVLFSAEHANELIEFGSGISGRVLVHCTAGLSRSPACAFVLAAAELGPGREDEAANAIARWPAGGGFPNTLIVHVADDVMQRGGALRRAWTKKWYERGDYDWDVPT